MAIANGLYYFAHNEDDWSRPAVILIHGAGGNHLSWPPEVRRLGSERIYAIDLPGHGKSEGIGRQSIQDYAQSVLDFMAALKIRKAIFVGHSMGGAVAQMLATEYPRKTLGIGLVSTGASLRVSPALLNNLASPSTLALAVQSIIDWSFSPQADARMKELVYQRMLEIRHSVLQGDLMACDAFEHTMRIGKVKVPSLILCGAADKMTPLRMSSFLHEKIKGSMFYTVPDAGHMVMLEDPQTVANMLQLFLRGITYQPGAKD